MNYNSHTKGQLIMNGKTNYRLMLIWISSLLILSWGIALFTVGFPYDHAMPYSPILMYLIYSLLAALSVASLIFAFYKPRASDILITLVLGGYFVLFAILFAKRLLVGYVTFFPTAAISLAIMAAMALSTAVALAANKPRLGYTLSIILYSFFLLCVIFESYPIVDRIVSETYSNLKLVYFFTLISASILGIVYSAKRIKELR